MQILKIVKNKTVRGLSLPSFELDVALCVIHTLYCYSTALPFSAYGDAVASLIQNTILLILVYYYGKISYARRLAVSTILISFILCAYNGLLPVSFFREKDEAVGALSMELITQAFLMNQVIFIVSRGMQITKTWREKDASQLSISTYGLIQLGKTIRIFTTIKEGATMHLIGASILGHTFKRKLPRSCMVCMSRRWNELHYGVSDPLLWPEDQGGREKSEKSVRPYNASIYCLILKAVINWMGRPYNSLFVSV